MIKTISVSIAVILLSALAVSAQTTLDWWQFWTDPAIKPTIEQMVAEFEQSNPGIDVRITDLTWANGHEKIVIGFASGSGPDIVELGSDWIAQFAAAGQIADISGQIGGDSAEYDGWGMATYEGKIYARPWILGTRVLYYNQDLLSDAGFDSDWVPIRLTQFENAVKKITEEGRGRDVWGWGSNTAEKHRLYKKFLPFFWSYGAHIFTDNREYVVIASSLGVNALKMYKRLHDQYAYVSNQRGLEDAFLEGKIGFVLSGDWLLKRIELENRDINFGTTLFPGPEYPGRSFLGGEFLAVNKDTEDKEAALKFISFITSPENQVRFCKANRSANPSSKVAQQDEYFMGNPHLQTFIKQLQLAKHPPVHPDWVYIEDELETAVEQVLFEDKEPATALLEAQHRITDILNQEE